MISDANVAMVPLSEFSTFDVSLDLDHSPIGSMKKLKSNRRLMGTTCPLTFKMN
jgi:hypothetical protein